MISLSSSPARPDKITDLQRRYRMMRR